MDATEIREIQAYAYFFFTFFLVVVLYGYIFHLYRSQKKGIRDYEKYSKLALDDDLTDNPVEAKGETEDKKEK